MGHAGCIARGMASIETGRIGLLNDWGRISLAMHGLVVEVAGAFDFRRQLAPGWRTTPTACSWLANDLDSLLLVGERLRQLAPSWRTTPCRNFDVQQLNSIFFSTPLVFGWFHS